MPDEYDFQTALEEANKALMTPVPEGWKPSDLQKGEPHYIGAVKQAGVQAVRGLGGFPELIGQKLIPGEDVFERWGKSFKGHWDKVAQNDPDIRDYTRAIQQGKEPFVTEWIGSIGPTAAAVLLRATPYAGPLLATAYFYRLNEEEVYDEAIRRGADKDSARRLSYVGGLVNTALDMTGLEVMRGSFRGRKLLKMIAGLSVAGAVEGGTEAVQEGVTYITSSWAAKDPQETSGEFAERMWSEKEEIFKRAGHAFKIAAPTGILFGGAHQAVQALQQEEVPVPTDIPTEAPPEFNAPVTTPLLEGPPDYAKMDAFIETKAQGEREAAEALANDPKFQAVEKDIMRTRQKIYFRELAWNKAAEKGRRTSERLNKNLAKNKEEELTFVQQRDKMLEEMQETLNRDKFDEEMERQKIWREADLEREKPTTEFAHYMDFPASREDPTGLMVHTPMYNIVGGEFDGSTVSKEGLKEKGIEVPETPTYEVAEKQRIGKIEAEQERWGLLQRAVNQIKPERQEMIRDKIQQLGSVEAVNNFYTGHDIESQFARAIAPQDLGTAKMGIPITLESAEEQRKRAVIQPVHKINNITREEAGRMIANGDEAIYEHVVQGIKEHGPVRMQDAIRNQALFELRQAKTPAEKQRVMLNLKKVMPKLDEMLKTEVIPAARMAISPDDMPRRTPWGTMWANRAKKEWPLTKNPFEAGFILRDGTMLNFGRDRDVYGHRWVSHGDIKKVMEQEMPGVSREDAVIQFLVQSGAIRTWYDYGRGWMLDMAGVPSESQEMRLAQGIKELRKFDEDLIFDISDRFGMPIYSEKMAWPLSLEKLRTAVGMAYSPKELAVRMALEKEAFLERGRRLDADELRIEMGPIVNNWKNAPQIEYYNVLEEIPLEYVAQLDKAHPKWRQLGLKGAFIQTPEGKDSVFLLGENITGIADAQHWLLHEINGHYGLRKAFGKDLDPILDAVWDHYGRKGMEDLVGKYTNYNPNTTEGRRSLAEEKLSNIAATGENPTLWDKIVMMFKDMLRGLGFSLKMGTADIKHLVHIAGRYVAEGPVWAGTGVEAAAFGIKGQPVSPFYSRLIRSVEKDFAQMPAKVQSLISPPQAKNKNKWLERKAKPEELKWMQVEQWLKENQKDGRIDKKAFLEYLQAHDIQMKERLRGPQSTRVGVGDGLIEMNIDYDAMRARIIDDMDAGGMDMDTGGESPSQFVARQSEEELDEIYEHFGLDLPLTVPTGETDITPAREQAESEVLRKSKEYFVNRFDEGIADAVIGLEKDFELMKGLHPTLMMKAYQKAMKRFYDEVANTTEVLDEYLVRAVDTLGTDISAPLGDRLYEAVVTAREVGESPLGEAIVNQLPYNSLIDRLGGMEAAAEKFGIPLSEKPEPSLPVKHPTYQAEGESVNYRELELIWVPPRGKRSEGYGGSHYNEETLMWVLFNERVLPNGESTIHIEEMQSDWLQAAKKTGFAEEGGKTGPPQAPFLDSWWNYGLKRMVRWAAEQGFDRVSWNTGKTLIDRYSTELRQSIDKIEWERISSQEANINYSVRDYDVREVIGMGEEYEGRWAVHHETSEGLHEQLTPTFSTREEAEQAIPGGPPVKRQGGAVRIKTYKDGKVNFDHVVPMKGTTKILGRDVSLDALLTNDEQIKAVREGKKSRGTFEGPDLTIGGAGMVMFYDKRLVGAAEELARDFGAKYEKIDIVGGKGTKMKFKVRESFHGGSWAVYELLKSGDTGEIAGELGFFSTPEEAQSALDIALREGKLGQKKTPGLKGHSITISPQMKEVALYEGFAKMALGGIPDNLKKYIGRTERTNTEIMTDAWEGIRKKTFWDKAAFKLVDRLHPIKVLLGEKAYQLARLETGFIKPFAMFLEHGRLKMDPSGAIACDESKQGFLPWLQESFGKDGKKFLVWTMARRAETLEAEGRERWLTKEARDEIYKWAGGRENARWEEKANELNEFNKNILDLAEQAGLIDGEARKGWEQHYYIPFYRLLDTPEGKHEFLVAPFKSRKYISARIKELKGAEMKVGDPLENMMRNWMHLIQESMRNMSRAEAFNYSKRNDLGLIQEVGVKEVYFRKGPEGKEQAIEYISKKTGENVLVFQKGGKPVYFKVLEPDLFSALGNMNTQRLDGLLVKMLSLPKKALTYGATFGPAFRVANMLRDTMHTAMMEKSFFPFLDTARGLLKAWREDPDYITFMASGAGFGSSYVRADDPKTAAKYVSRILHMEGRGAVNRILDTPSKMLDWWEKVGAVSENAARVQLYAKERRKGTSHLEAAFKARDLLDFTMRGDSGFVQFLIMTIPFLNARMQGLYKIGRVAADERTRGNLVRRGILLAMAGVGLWFLYKDDDRYKELEDWDKRTYHHFWFGDLHYRIPRPFEMGVPSALMEHVGNVMNGDEQWKHVFDFLKFTFTETFAIDMPQVVKPIAEQWANKSTFTGRPIVGEHLKGLLPSEQNEIWTSESMQKLGELINVSPKRLEELVQGYLSVFGTLLLTGLDSTVTTMFEFPEEPEGRIDDYPMIGRFVKEARDPRYTKYYSRFYDLWTEYDRTMRTIKHHHEMRDVDKAQSLVKNKQKLIRMGPLLTQVRKELTHLRANMKLILQSKLTGKEKEKRLEPFVKRRNVLMKVAYDKVINEL